MGECLVQKTGSTVSTTGITAEEEDVLEGSTFLRKDEKVGIGSIKKIGSPQITLKLNGSAALEKGYYTGGSVRQNIATSPGETVYAGKHNVVVNTKGKFMNGNIIQASIKNLIPAFIKKGQYVGGVGPGTWEGYVNEDPNVPFLYGTFGPDHGMSSLLKHYGAVKGYAGTSKQSIDMIVSHYSQGGINYSESIAIVFTKEINLSLYNRIVILASSNSTLYGDAYIYRNKNESWMSKTTGDNPDLGEKVAGYMQLSNGSETIIDISSCSGFGYLYIALRNSLGGDRDASIYYVKYE